MKKLFFLVVFLQWTLVGLGQSEEGRIVIERITSSSLHNSGGENPVRRVTVYLPPGYDKKTGHYPVIYYLHGFGRSDSLQINAAHFDQLLDQAIQSGKLRPVIVVMPNHYTRYKGSWYSNSSLTGNWADYTAKDLVQYIDSHYRTIPHAASRGIAGHSMGGYGALKIAMLFPDVFANVYALSPSRLALIEEFGPTGEVFKQAQKIGTQAELFRHYEASLAIAMGRALSPNPTKPPFYCDLPFSYQEDSLIVNEQVLILWNQNSPLGMIDRHKENLSKLKAIKFDWGRNDESRHIPLSCRQLSQKLEVLGIEHYAEEYIGTHINKLWTQDGRALNDMFPFFDTYLNYQEHNHKPLPKKKKQ